MKGDSSVTLPHMLSFASQGRRKRIGTGKTSRVGGKRRGKGSLTEKQEVAPAHTRQGRVEVRRGEVSLTGQGAPATNE